jgi:hypothetical protein
MADQDPKIRDLPFPDSPPPESRDVQVATQGAAGGPRQRGRGRPDAATLLTWNHGRSRRRRRARWIDTIVLLVTLVPHIGWILYLAAFLVNAYFEGKTGQTLGKRVMGIYTIKADTGEFIGGWLGIVRTMLHALDTLALGSGWIVGRITNRTYADRIMGTVVVSESYW